MRRAAKLEGRLWRCFQLKRRPQSIRSVAHVDSSSRGGAELDEVPISIDARLSNPGFPL